MATAAIDWVTSHPEVDLTVPTTTWVKNLPYQISYTTNTAPCVETGGVTGDGWGGPTGVHVAKTVTETAPGNYTFTVTASTTGYSVTAVPDAFGSSGRRTFFSDQTLVIRNNWTQEPANAASPEIR